MHLFFDTYKCSKCEHFDQDMFLADQNDPTKLQYCNCAYCLKKRNGMRL